MNTYELHDTASLRWSGWRRPTQSDIDAIRATLGATGRLTLYVLGIPVAVFRG